MEFEPWFFYLDSKALAIAPLETDTFQENGIIWTVTCKV